MGAKPRSWREQMQRYRRAIGVVAIVLIVVVVIALIIAVVLSNGTGFNGYNKVTIAHTISGTNAGTVIKTEEYQPGKALWDWLQLLIIPLVLAVAALLFNFANSRTEREIAAQRHAQDQQFAKERYEQDQQISLDKQREDLLQAYLDRMSELLLKEKLRSSEADAEVRNVARVRTITILFQLDARRIGFVFAFLREARLMSPTFNDNVVSLGSADFHAVNWSQADLNQANLSYAKLSQANLSYANLSYANLLKANLSYASLSKANLSEANLAITDLTGAKLSQAKVTGEQLAKAKSLKDATMPDGSIHS